MVIRLSSKRLIVTIIALVCVAYAGMGVVSWQRQTSHDHIIPIATPPPSAATPFVSDPDPRNGGARYIGAVTFAITHSGGGRTLVITNTGTIPLPVKIEDFCFTYVNPDLATGSGIINHVRVSDWTDVVAPGETVRNAFEVLPPTLGVVWRIGGIFGSIALPRYDGPRNGTNLPPSISDTCEAFHL